MRVQFSIRELLLMITVIALISGWWIDHKRINSMLAQKWEFKLADFYVPDPELKNDGVQGWEICGAYTTPDSPRSPIVILKRRIP